MKKIKVVTIIGARPQFIKASVVSKALKLHDIKEIIIHTGQHFDQNMSDIFFEEMQIPKPDYNLNINGLGHGAMTGKMLEAIEPVLLQEKPDWVLVYGDTNSTLAGALAAKKLYIKVLHVEAGLRLQDLDNPEEINRVLTDRISDVLFCPTPLSVKNLKAEGYENFNCKIVMNGDVMLDSVLHYAALSRKPATNLPDKFILTTIHRAENTEDPTRLFGIFKALEDISEESTVVLPLHPRTLKKLETIGYDLENTKIQIIPPVGYLEMLYLLKNCQIVMTDSGGLQKEAYFLKKHAVILQEGTAWIEIVRNGANLLAGADTKMIKDAYHKLLNKKDYSFDLSIFGNGCASDKIAEEILNNEK